MSKPVISVIVVSFNTKDVLRECLNSLRKVTIPLEIFIVDNTSQDGTLEMLKGEFAGWSALSIIYNDKNVGFTRASNQPISACAGRYILFLNPDTIIRPGGIATMAAYLDSHEDVGVVGPKLVYEDSSLQASCGPVWSLLHTILWHMLPYKFAEFVFVRCRYEAWARQGPRDVGWVLGACLMIRRILALELGGFDENFFLSAQDAADLCIRVLQKGYRIVYYPNVEIIHLGGMSYKDTNADARALALLRVYQGHLYYHKKHHGAISAIILRVMFFLLALAKGMIAGVLASSGRSERYRIVFRTHLAAARRMFTLPISNAEGHEKR
jgi:GT2 family glycosyltransferase